jgi:tight adherence protein C
MTLPIDLIFEILTFLFLVAVTLAFSNIIRHFSSQRRRLGQPTSVSLLAEQPLLKRWKISNPFLLWVQSSTSIGDSNVRQKLIRELASAGFHHPAAPIWYVIFRFSMAIGLPLGFLFSRTLFVERMDETWLIFWTLALCGAGLLAPSAFISRRASRRRAELEREFPDALDLMVVCVEAGLSLDAAFVRVGQEIGESHPRIAEEFARVSEELRAGRGLTETLRAMGDRSDVNGVKSFAALVIQTEALGVSIAQTLRTYSIEMRETRFLKAEEKAMRIPVLMTIPLVLCILPVVVTAVMLPASIDVVRNVIPALRGHPGGG